MRYIGIDVHQSFCEVAIASVGRSARRGRIETAARRSSCSPSLGARRSGRDGGDRPGVRDRADPRAPRRAGGGRQRPGGSGDLPCQGQVRPLRRAHLGASCWRPGCSTPVWVPIERTGRCGGGSPAARAGAPAHPGEERGPCGARALPARAPPSATCSARPGGPGSPASSCRARSARRSRLPAPDRLPRRGDRDGRASSREWALGSPEAQAADDDPRRRRRHRGDADGGDRRHRPLRRAAPAGRLPGP